MRRHRKRNLVATLAAAILIGLPACAAGGAGDRPVSGRSAPRATEPTLIAIANNTGETLLVVVVSEATTDGTGARMGRIEPLTRGSLTTIQRRTNAPRLAGRIRVEWTTPDGQPHSQIVDVSRLLKQRVSESGDTLLFEIANGVTVRRVPSSELNPFGS
jgi:hypothetical protein